MADRVVAVGLTLEASQYVQGMTRASAATNKTAQSADKMGTSVDKTGRKMNTFKNIALYAFGYGVAAGAAIAAKAVLKTVMDFEVAMSKLQAASQATADEMDALGEAALDAGRNTVFTATEAADAMTELAKAGVSTTDVLDGALTGALDLAAAGTVDVGFAAETAATAMVQFNRGGDEMSHIADLLAAGAGKAQGGVEELSLALRQGGQVASMVGWSLEDTTATLSSFAAAGLLGSDAGTSLKTMLLRLANPAGKARDVMREYGLSVYDSNGQMVGASELAGRLQVAFQDLSPQARNAAMGILFGTDAVRAANVLYSQGAEGIDNWNAKVQDSGYAARVAEQNMDNLVGDLQRLKGSFEALAVEEGGAFTDVGRGLASTFEGILNAIDDINTALDYMNVSGNERTNTWMGVELEDLGDLAEAYRAFWRQWDEGGGASEADKASAEASDRRLHNMAAERARTQELRDETARLTGTNIGLQASMEDMERADEDVADAKEQLADAYDALRDAQDEAWDSMEKWTSSTQQSRELTLNYEEAVDNLADALGEEGVVFDATTGKLDLNSDASRNAEQATWDLADSVRDQILTQAEAIRSTEGHEAALAFLQEQTKKNEDGTSLYEQRLYDAFIQSGHNEEAARTYAEALAASDIDVENVFTTPGLQEAQTNIDILRGRIEDLATALQIVSQTSLSFDDALSLARQERNLADRATGGTGGAGVMHGDLAMPQPADAINGMAAQLSAKIDQWEKDIRELVAASQSSGYILPEGSYYVSSPYGMRNGTLHGGVDLAAPTGTPVFAPWSGTAIAASAGAQSYGNYVFLSSAGQYDFLGAHLSAFGATGYVSKGTVIGYVGSTGNSTGPHLHAEARTKSGARVNPQGILKYDTGGWLMPGQVGVNMSGRPEPILTNAQWQAIRGLAAGLNGGDGDGIRAALNGATLRLDGVDYLSNSVTARIETSQRRRVGSR